MLLFLLQTDQIPVLKMAFELPSFLSQHPLLCYFIEALWEMRCQIPAGFISILFFGV